MSTMHDTSLDRKDAARLVLAVVLNQISQGVYITLPYTLSVYMVRSFLPKDASEHDIGRMTGGLAAAAAGAQCATSFLIGSLSDRIGRKPVILAANMAACISVTALGLATKYHWALLSRVLGGLITSGNGVAVKALIGEHGDLTFQARALGWMVTGWGTGTVLGPALGGLLANPCSAYGSGFMLCGPDELFRKHPFLLPCLCSASLALLACLQNIFLMPASQLHSSSSRASRDSRVGRAHSTNSRASVAYARLPSFQQDEDEPGDLRSSLAKATSAGSGSAMLELSTAGTARTGSIPYMRLASFEPDSRQVWVASAVSPHPGAESAVAGDTVVRVTAAAGSRGTAGVPNDPQQLHETPAQQRQQQQDGQEELQRQQQLSQQRQQQQQQQQQPPPQPHTQHQQQLQHEQQENRRNQQQQQQQHGHQEQEQEQQWHHHQQLELQKHQQHHGSSSSRRSSSDAEPADVAVLITPDAPAIAAAGEVVPWYKQRAMVLALLGAGVVTFVLNMVDELTPMLASAATARGGLGMTEQQLAGPMAAGGLMLVVFSVAVFPAMHKRWGSIRCVQIGLGGMVPASLMMPTAAAVAGAGAAAVALAVVYGALGLRSVLKTMVLSSSSLLINKVASRSHLGAINGAAQTMQSLARALGPALAGAVWGVLFGISAFLPFALVCAGSLACMGLYAYMQATT